MIEYALILACIAVVVISLLNLVGHLTYNVFCSVSNGLTGGGSVATWGDNQYGELGNGTTGGQSNIPVTVPNLCDVGSVAGGIAHNVALKSDGTVWAWGHNTDGQIGDGTLSMRNSPVQVLGLPLITRISARGYGTMALSQDGHVYTWGRNNVGEAGNAGSPNPNKSPTEVTVGACAAGADPCGADPYLNSIIAIGQGLYTGVALRSDGNVYTWGDDSFGQLGNGSFCTGEPCLGSATPVLATISNVVGINAGANNELALDSSNNLYSWGVNNADQTGNACTSPCMVPSQTTLPGITGSITGFSDGYAWGMASTSAGGIWTWGKNTDGESANNGAINVPPVVLAPTKQVADPSLQSISAGTNDGMAILGGYVYMWGLNDKGQLGNGSSGTSSATPTGIAGLKALRGDATGGSHAIVTLLQPLS
jgi:alpha-tubulin suppressor-like RCC1 family protein